MISLINRTWRDILSVIYPTYINCSLVYIYKFNRKLVLNMQSYLKLWSRPRRDYYVATKEEHLFRSLYKKGRQFDTDRRSQMIQWRALQPLDGHTVCVRTDSPQMPLYGTVLAWVHERISVKLDLGECISTRKSWKMITTSELIEISWLYNTVDRKLHGLDMIPTYPSL